MSNVIAHAPAKINLALEVAPRSAGEEKHCLDSIFCTTSLADTLVFDFMSGVEPFNVDVSIEKTDLDFSFMKKHDNTLTKTVEQFKREYGSDFLPTGTLKVQLIKSIPTQAGLGGGSSDAAATLRMLCWLAQVEPLTERNLKVAQAVGADVPFFLYAGKTGLCARMGGYGDEFMEELPKPTLFIALVKPARGVSTRRAFGELDSSAHKEQKTHDVEKLAQVLKKQGGLLDIAEHCANNLEPAAIKLLPAIATVKKELTACEGVLGVTLSGSGSALFAICKSAEASRAVVEQFSRKGFWAVAACT